MKNLTDEEFIDLAGDILAFFALCKVVGFVDPVLSPDMSECFNRALKSFCALTSISDEEITQFMQESQVNFDKKLENVEKNDHV